MWNYWCKKFSNDENFSYCFKIVMFLLLYFFSISWMVEISRIAFKIVIFLLPIIILNFFFKDERFFSLVLRTASSFPLTKGTKPLQFRASKSPLLDSLLTRLSRLSCAPKGCRCVRDSTTKTKAFRGEVQTFIYWDTPCDPLNLRSTAQLLQFPLVLKLYCIIDTTHVIMSVCLVFINIQSCNAYRQSMPSQ